jgi:hypothetical protein
MEILLGLFIIFLIPIITDFVEFSCYVKASRNLIYIFIKTAVYILYPFFIVYFLDFVKMTWHNRDITENFAWFLFFGGIIALMFAKYKALKYFEIKTIVYLLLVEIFYIPIIYITVVIYFW